MVKRVLGIAFVGMVGCAAPGTAPDVQPVESGRPAASARAPAASAGPAEVAPPPAPADAGAPEQAPDAAAGEVAAQDAGTTDAGATEQAPAFAADNKVKPPLESPDLTERARALFEAIAKNEPPLGDPFWFPREPFIPLKDVKGPGKYWDNLHAAYANDIKALHRKRKSWEGAQFVGFEVGSTPKWVPPGDEANKIGYYRSFHGKLKYELDGKPAFIDVHTIISWQGRWYITHLSKFKK